MPSLCFEDVGKFNVLSVSVPRVQSVLSTRRDWLGIAASQSRTVAYRLYLLAPNTLAANNLLSNMDYHVW